MKKLLIIWLLFANVLLFADVIYVVNSGSRTLSKVDLAQGTVNNRFAVLGNVANRVVVEDDALWVVNSADNTMQKISPTSGATLANYFLNVGSNPWDAVIDGDYIYVCGLVDYKLYKMNKNSGQIEASLLLGPAPEGMAIHAGKLYVSNVGDYMADYEGSSLVVIDLASFTVQKELVLPPNPQYITVDGDNLHISCTGNWFDISGSIVVFDTITDEIVQEIPIGGSPGNVWVSPSRQAYVSDAGGESLYSYHADSFALINPADNPLPYPASYVLGTASHIAILDPNWGGNGVLQWRNADLQLVSSFELGIMPTDMALWQDPTSNENLVYPATQQLLQLYPNPLKNKEALKLKAEVSGEFSLYNIRGQKLHESSISHIGEASQQFDLPKGVYLYQFQTAQGRQSGKLLLK